MARLRRDKREEVVPPFDPILDPCDACRKKADLTADVLALTAGATVVSAALQMMLDQAHMRGESMRSSHHSSNLTHIAELAALGSMLTQMFSSPTTRSVAVKASSSVPAPTPLAVS